ncbi:PIG-L family deacetylase [Alcaligenes nematophilus]|uniref:PIG-L family deacetylase n=1 Tax=Alcaligenes nematophilus TaxID=2994643 RepID=UPI0024645579|nr:PIG-L family deacetylase [Alcaligenes nematophilus]MDH4868267.1 PIG-L family deacetylase [Bacillus cereus]MDY7129580.1 PIG-L family deacetylase [Alcaligenes nematophilus]
MYLAFSAGPSLKHRLLGALCALLLSFSAQAADACHGSRDLVVVGHMDDDLLFMNPDLSSNIQAGGCMQVLYLTASERKGGLEYMYSREQGVRAAYAYMAGLVNEWQQTRLMVGSASIAQFTLRARPGIQLSHLRLQDPWLGPGWGSLTPLSRAESVPGQTVQTLDSPQQTLNREQLVQTLAALIRLYRPTSVRYLDDTNPVPYTQLCWRCSGHGHPDHIASARLVREAMLAAPGNYAQIGYVDYPIQEQARNLTLNEIHSKTEIFRRYAWHDQHACKGPAVCQEPAGPAAAWVQRSYYTSRADYPASLLSDKEGRLSFFVSGEQNDAINQWDVQEQRWTTLGGRTADALNAFQYADGSPGLFARDASGQVWFSRAPDEDDWLAWQKIPGPRVLHTPMVSRRDSQALAMGTDGRFYWSAARQPDYGWSAWKALPVLEQPAYPATLSLDKQGRTHVFASNLQGQLFQTSQQNDSKWQAWQAIPVPPISGGLASILNAQGQIELYMRDRQSQHLQRLSQDSQQRWSHPQDLGLNYVGTPALSLGEKEQVVVAIQKSPGGAIVLLDQGQEQEVDKQSASQPVLYKQNGTLYLASRPIGPEQRYRLLERRHGKWVQVALTQAPPPGGGQSFSEAPAFISQDYVQP